jgi:hypothetical protein
MLFTPPFVEGWRSKQRLQNRKACACSCQVSLEHSKYHPKTQLAWETPKESPVENCGPRFKLCVSHGTQYLTRHPSVRFLPPKGNRQTLSANPGRCHRSLSVFITWVFDLNLSCGKYFNWEHWHCYDQLLIIKINSARINQSLWITTTYAIMQWNT